MHLLNTKSKELKTNKKTKKLTSVLSGTCVTGQRETRDTHHHSPKLPASDKTGSVVWENVRCFRKADTVHVTCELNSRGKFHNSHVIFMIKEKVTISLVNNNSPDKFFLFWRSQQNSKAGSPPPRISYSVRCLRLCQSPQNNIPKGT